MLLGLVVVISDQFVLQVSDLQGQAMVPLLQVGELHQLHLAALLQGLNSGAQLEEAVRGVGAAMAGSRL
jgi:hypothetical protein